MFLALVAITNVFYKQTAIETKKKLEFKRQGSRAQLKQMLVAIMVR